MNEEFVTATILHYFAGNHEKLKGSMPYENRFNVKGVEVAEVGVAPYRLPGRIVEGVPADILANLIEKRCFFGHNSAEPRVACDSKNSQIIPVYRNSRFQSGSELSRKIIRMESKNYLDPLRTPEGLKQMAHSLEIKGNWDKIASSLFGLKY